MAVVFVCDCEMVMVVEENPSELYLEFDTLLDTSSTLAHHFRGVYRMCLNLRNGNSKMSTCNQLGLKTLTSSPIMQKKISHDTNSN